MSYCLTGSYRRAWKRVRPRKRGQKFNISVGAAQIRPGGWRACLVPQLSLIQVCQLTDAGREAGVLRLQRLQVPQRLISHTGDRPPRLVITRQLTSRRRSASLNKRVSVRPLWRSLLRSLKLESSR